MITLFWYPNSRAARTRWLLEELGVDYECVFVDIRNPDAPRDPRFMLASPMGKVPAIADGDVLMADGTAIALYLADKFAEAGLAPGIDGPLRPRYLYWMVYMGSVMEPAMAQKFGNWETNPQSIGWGNFDIMIKTLEKALISDPWLIGKQFSAADILVGSTLNFMKLFGIMPENEVLSAYLERCLERPAYQRTIEADRLAVENM